MGNLALKDKDLARRVPRSCTDAVCRRVLMTDNDDHDR